jgi:zinc transport system substrate-binding protein
MGKKFHFICFAAALCGAGFFLAGCVREKPARSKKIVVVTTLFPLYDLAKNIGGEKTEVSLLLPPGVEPHSFEPTPRDMVRINEADLFIYTGEFMEPWAKDVINGVANKKLLVVDAGRGVKLLPAAFRDPDEPNAAVDPHIWMDFDNAKTMVENIAQALTMKDPADKSFYDNNAQAYERKLASTDAAFKSGLAHCRSKEIVYGGHYALGYLARRYGLDYVAAQGLSPDSEPTVNDLTRLTDQIKKNRIKYVFYEELFSPKIAETLANETGAKLLPLNAGHNITREQMQKNVSFLDILREDLANLKTGLGCE